MIRNRMDAVRLLLGKDGGYTLRTFKKIVKRDRAEKPELVDARIAQLGAAPEKDNLDDELFEDVDTSQLDMSEF